MINIETKKELLEHFQTLHPEVQNLIRNIQLEQALETIQEIEPLEGVQKTSIQNEIILIFLGLSDVVSLTTNIRNSAQISRDRAEKISNAIQQSILMPNIGILEKVFEVSEEKREKSTEDIRRVPPTSQKKIEQRPLTERSQQNPLHQTIHHSGPSPTPPPNTSSMFANKISEPMLIQNKEEKVDVKVKNENHDKPKHVDPYREAVD